MPLHSFIQSQVFFELDLEHRVVSKGTKRIEITYEIHSSKHMKLCQYYNKTPPEWVVFERLFLYCFLWFFSFFLL